ncbi:unnamed protein product [Rhizophagus irregularis]|nr:unnamed protein product [Rhizophagus irregularis]
MSASPRTTRSAAQKGIDNQEQGETMEGVVGTTSSTQETLNTFNFEQLPNAKRQEVDPFVAYNLKDAQQKKKTKNGETLKNVDPIMTHSASATPIANKGKDNVDQSDVPQMINTQNQDDQLIQDDSHLDDPSADNQLPEKEMADAEYSPIVLSKHNTWKATCTIPEAPNSTQFCHYIVKIIKSRIDVVTTFEEKN